ncbi:MAG: ABC transporter permease [Rhodospirillaceae bacterium]|nr:ABC transporter permease [Rhodospirillaceae bacterium]|tara:strand:+ start:689 stop:1729 length:1041 start_codon:yes stop_codon:yes gene_type:complete
MTADRSKQYFGSWQSSAVTIVSLGMVTYVLLQLGDWGIVNSVWKTEAGQGCDHDVGACWAVITDRYRLIFFGLFPHEEHWRSAMAMLVITVTGVLSCLPVFWKFLRISLLWAIGFITFILLMRGGFFGMPLVKTAAWGGLSLTLIIFAATVAIGMPLSIVITFARRSSLPVLRYSVSFVVDITRSLPLVTILFTAAFVLPFGLPDWAEGDILIRVILAFAFFFACYQSEVLRAGLQAIPDGQYDGARALGLNRWQEILLIILPQAFRNALPPTINQIVITFKETSLVVIIGLFEILASANAAYGTAIWANTYVEVYVLVAAVYFTFVFCLSRYGAYLERKMRIGEN